MDRGRRQNEKLAVTLVNCGLAHGGDKYCRDSVWGPLMKAAASVLNYLCHMLTDSLVLPPCQALFYMNGLIGSLA